jgi:para-nitrobenzyl esterase
MSTDQIQQASTKSGMAGIGRFSPTIDGYFFPEEPAAIYAAGKQAHVPLLVGWNSEEMNWRFLLGRNDPTPENYQATIRELYGESADEVMKLYPASTQDEVIASATDLAGDRFIAFSTWKWFDLHSKTGGSPVYRYFFSRPRPPMSAAMGNASPGLAGGVIKGSDGKTNVMPPARGAVHSAEIEYALGNLSSNKVYAWTPDDYKVSKLMQEYFANFIKKGTPDGPGLLPWPSANSSNGGDTVQVMRLDVESSAEPDKNRARYVFLDQLSTKR